MTSKLNEPETMIRYLKPFIFPSTRISNLGEGFKWYTRWLPSQGPQKTTEEINNRKQRSQGTNTDLQAKQTWHIFVHYPITDCISNRIWLCIYTRPGHRQNALKLLRCCGFTFNIFLTSLQFTLENACSWLKEKRCSLSKILDISKVPWETVS